MRFVGWVVMVMSSFFLLNFSFSYKVLDFFIYRQYIDGLSKYDLSKVKFSNLQLDENSCFYFTSGDYFYLTPVCLYYKQFPKIDIKDFANLVFPYIKGFNPVYDLNSTGFFYNKAKVKLYSTSSLSGYVGTGKVKLLFDFVLSKLGYFVKIPKIEIALYDVDNYSFFVAGKDLSKRNKGRLQNFNVAINATDNTVLYPDGIFYFNKKVAYLPGYYVKGSRKKYAFYGGVCGVSTMFFRNALINPYLYVLKRYNHNHRYVYFYSKYLYGDDAAVYQFTKTLKVINISNKPILFKTKRIGKEIYLVSLISKKWDGVTYVKKGQIGKLKARVSKTVYNPDGTIWYKQVWISNYFGYDYER